MKTKLTILLLIISLSIKAQIGWNAVPITGITGLCVFAAYNSYCHDDYDSENGLYTSIGLDPKMLLMGDDEIGLPVGSLDCRLKAAYKYNRINPYLVWEIFSYVNYESYSGGIDYAVIDRRLGLLTGFEIGRTHNQNQQVWCYGLNVEAKYWTKEKNVFFGVTYNPETSFELTDKKMRHNVYVSTGIRISKIKLK